MKLDTDTNRYCNTCMQSGGSLSRTALPSLGKQPYRDIIRVSRKLSKTKNILQPGTDFCNVFLVRVQSPRPWNQHSVNTVSPRVSGVFRGSPAAGGGRAG